MNGRGRKEAAGGRQKGGRERLGGGRRERDRGEKERSGVLYGGLPWIACTRWLSLTATCNKEGYGYKWRLSSGQARDNTKYGSLTDGPDYTYLDGRPTPLSKGQMKRREERINTTNKVMQLLKEVDYAKDNFQKKSYAPDVPDRISFKPKS
ncbi:hypothetical protein FSP39_021803 [Pinctada imbricata]|uniref:Large ribosomal subunit protein mL52 n=1 Tax=Pinctada imbricata TaxID=66713 RepID=A0AA88XK33_PINIB|nr:hypothetical protein FSP39_021803 [Pinctada imbricata]